SYRPFVEELEQHLCPSVTLTLNAVVQAGHQVQLTGTATGDGADDCHVHFYGAASDNTWTDANGNFSLTTTQATTGWVYAYGVLADMVTYTNTASASIFPNVGLSLSVTYGAGQNVTLWGTLSSLDPGSRTVTFSGAVSGTATTNSSGSF